MLRIRDLAATAIFISGTLAIAPLIRSATTTAPAAKAPQKTEYFKGVVGKVTDGDTINVLSERGGMVKVRLACIDAPEKAQKPWGTDSLKALYTKVFNQAVRVESVAIDQYGRSIGKVFLGEEFVNLTMVAQGNAVVYRKYLKPCPDHERSLLDAEAEAKLRRRGFWNQEKVIMPWDWRNGVR
jgi:micrococcal nuclease